MLRTSEREYVFLDAPGHVQFIKNMITGAAQADAALLVVDACDNIQENSRRHAMLLPMLGINQVMVIVNKMDLVRYEKAAFEAVVDPFEVFLDRIGVGVCRWIPVAARLGQNVSAPSGDLWWYEGPTLLEALEAFTAVPPPTDRWPFRLPVQDVYKSTAFGDDRRIFAGTVEMGQASVGDELVFWPSGRRARVESIEAFSARERTTVSAGQAVGLRMTPEVFVTRGELASRADERQPIVANGFRVSLFWLSPVALTLGTEVIVRVHMDRVPATVQEINLVLDAAEGFGTRDLTEVRRHELAHCTLRLRRPIAFDLPAFHAPTGRVVLEVDGNICGGGLIVAAPEGMVVDSPAKASDLRDSAPLSESPSVSQVGVT